MSLRILHVDPERGWGGGEEQVVGLVRYLKTQGHHVLVAADPTGGLWRAAAAHALDTHPLPIRHGFDFGAAHRLRRMAADVDVIHFHTARAHALAPWLGRLTARRVVTRRMDYLPRPRPYVRALYNRCVDSVVAISERIRDVLISAGVRPDRIRVIPSGVDTTRFTAAAEERDRTRRQDWGVAPTERVVLVVAALVARKGHTILLEAARAVRDQGLAATYVFCGDGEQRAYLERRVDQLDLAGIVRFMGWRSDVPRLLAAADVVALPSLHEGLGVAALEAMAASRPVIASRTGGLSEVVSDGETGWLVPPGDRRALARALVEALSEPERALAYGTAGRARAVSEFGMERMAAGNEALYRQLLDHTGGGMRGCDR